MCVRWGFCGCYSHRTHITFGILKIAMNVCIALSLSLSACDCVSVSSVHRRELQCAEKRLRRCRKHRGRDGVVVDKTFVLRLGLFLLFHFDLCSYVCYSYFSPSFSSILWVFCLFECKCVFVCVLWAIFPPSREKFPFVNSVFSWRRQHTATHKHSTITQSLTLTLFELRYADSERKPKSVYFFSLARSLVLSLLFGVFSDCSGIYVLVDTVVVI